MEVFGDETSFIQIADFYDNPDDCAVGACKRERKEYRRSLLMTRNLRC